MNCVLDAVLGGVWSERYGAVRRYWTSPYAPEQKEIDKIRHLHFSPKNFPWDSLGPKATEPFNPDNGQLKWLLWCERFKNETKSIIYVVSVYDEEPLLLRDEKGDFHVL